MTRQDLLNGIESGQELSRRPITSSFGEFQTKAFDLITGPAARQEFDLEQEPATLRDQYRRHPLGPNLLMARRRIESGVRLVSVTAWVGKPPGENFRDVQLWDMHGEGLGLRSSFGAGPHRLGWALPHVDDAVSVLLEDLRQRGCWTRYAGDHGGWVRT